MHWLKRDMWKASIAIAAMLLLLVLTLWVPASAVGTHERAAGPTTLITGTVQATPTEDATVTALNKEKLAQEVQQLKNQNTPDLFSWLRTNASILLSTLVVVIGGLIGLFRWFGDRQSEREKQAEERFQAAVTGLGDEKEGAKIGAAILLRTFLRPGYEQFYIQTFDLAVANLRLPRIPHLAEDPDGLSQVPEAPATPLPLTTLSQALIVVFKEAFPLARSQNKGGPRSLDATGIQLDNAYLALADLKRVRMSKASLRKANLSSANLSSANLRGADLRAANLFDADLSQTKLRGADLRRADLRRADLRQTRLFDADLSGAFLHMANFRGAYLDGADFDEANFRGDDLVTANLEDALTLKGTKLHGVKGLTKEQLEICKAKGAILDEDSTTSSPQSPVSSSSPSQSNDMYAP